MSALRSGFLKQMEPCTVQCFAEARSSRQLGSMWWKKLKWHCCHKHQQFLKQLQRFLHKRQSCYFPKLSTIWESKTVKCRPSRKGILLRLPACLLLFYPRINKHNFSRQRWLKPPNGRLAQMKMLAGILVFIRKNNMACLTLANTQNRPMNSTGWDTSMEHFTLTEMRTQLV